MRSEIVSYALAKTWTGVVAGLVPATSLALALFFSIDVAGDVSAFTRIGDVLYPATTP
jgi:hypothetical protein